MKLPLRFESLRRRAMISLLGGGMLLQLGLGGCDPEVRNAFLSGLQTSMVALVTTFINAFFLALTSTNVNTTNPSVEAVFEALKTFVC